IQIGGSDSAESGPSAVRSGKETSPRRSGCRTPDDVAHGIHRGTRSYFALSVNALAKARKPLLSWCCGSGICGSRFIDRDKDEVNHQPVTIPGYDLRRCKNECGFFDADPVERVE